MPRRAQLRHTGESPPRTESIMSLVTWIILGLVSGFIGSKLMGHRQGIVLDVALGVAGSVAGGLLFNLFGASGVTGLNLWSVFVAVPGSALLLFLFHGLRDRSQWSR
jgi:uncharacterized membrane protein YeaQ/YmgE (transglycosylase-associated protein family)